MFPWRPHKKQTKRHYLAYRTQQTLRHGGHKYDLLDNGLSCTNLCCSKWDESTFRPSSHKDAGFIVLSSKNSDAEITRQRIECKKEETHCPDTMNYKWYHNLQKKRDTLSQGDIRTHYTEPKKGGRMDVDTFRVHSERRNPSYSNQYRMSMATNTDLRILQLRLQGLCECEVQRGGSHKLME